METPPKPKMPPQQLAIIILTLMALALPLTAISIATIQYLKARQKMQQHSTPEIKGMEQQLDAAITRQFKDYEEKAATATVYGIPWNTARTLLEKIAASQEGVFLLADENKGTLFIKQKHLALTLSALAKENKNISLQDAIGLNAIDPEIWVAIEVIYDPDRK